jgi:hypothetical protein
MTGTSIYIDNANLHNIELSDAVISQWRNVIMPNVSSLTTDDYLIDSGNSSVPNNFSFGQMDASIGSLYGRLIIQTETGETIDLIQELDDLKKTIKEQQQEIDDLKYRLELYEKLDQL